MSGCIEWTGARTSAGYGERRVRGEVRYTHRLAWEQAHGPIPDGLVVMHLCDNPACYKLDHLLLGTVAANSADMMAKGRGRGQFQRQDMCKRGHPLTEDNLYIHPRDGIRECDTCRRDRAARRKVG